MTSGMSNPAASKPAALGRSIASDSIEYHVYLDAIDAWPASPAASSEQTYAMTLALDTLRHELHAVWAPFATGFLWHKEAFQLRLWLPTCTAYV